MKKMLAAVAIVILAATGCGGGDGDSNGPDVAACKAAMKKDFDTATTDPSGPSASKPEACNGVDDATVQRLAGEIMDEALNGK